MKTPENLNQLVNCLKEADNNTALISGGTDFVIQFRRNRNKYKNIIDLSGIKELKFIKEEKDFIRIGAETTLTEICESTIINKNFPALAQAAGQVGSTQIRNRATIPGNIGNSSPCADTVPPLMAVNAKLKIINGEGKIIEKSVDEVIEGVGKNNLKKDEAIIEVIIPKLSKMHKSAFSKLGSRKAVTISKLNMCVLINIDSDNECIKDSRVYLGSLGPKAFRSEIVEKALINKKISSDLLKDFSEALTEQVDIAIPGRSSREYKREAIKGLADDIFKLLFKRFD